MSRDYKKLKVFEQANKLVVDIYKITPAFPKSEMFGLTSQMRRAAVSVPANIVEGSYRASLNEYLHFLNISFSSLAELGYYIGLSHTLGYINDEVSKSLNKDHVACLKSLNALITSLKQKAQGPKPNA